MPPRIGGKPHRAPRRRRPSLRLRQRHHRRRLGAVARQQPLDQPGIVFVEDGHGGRETGERAGINEFAQHGHLPASRTARLAPRGCGAVNTAGRADGLVKKWFPTIRSRRPPCREAPIRQRRHPPVARKVHARLGNARLYPLAAAPESPGDRRRAALRKHPHLPECERVPPLGSGQNLNEGLFISAHHSQIVCVSHHPLEGWAWLPAPKLPSCLARASRYFAALQARGR